MRPVGTIVWNKIELKTIKWKLSIRCHLEQIKLFYSYTTYTEQDNNNLVPWFIAMCCLGSAAPLGGASEEGKRFLRFSHQLASSDEQLRRILESKTAHSALHIATFFQKYRPVTTWYIIYICFSIISILRIGEVIQTRWQNWKYEVNMYCVVGQCWSSWRPTRNCQKDNGVLMILLAR